METKAKKQITPSHTQTPQVIESQILHFKFKQCPPLQKANENEKHSRHTMLKGNVRRPSMRMKQVTQAVAKWTHRHHSLVWLRVRLRTKHSLTSSSNTKESKKKSTQIVSATQAKRLEMKWRLSCEESLLNLYKRQGATSMAQASSYVTITADSYPTTREWEVPKGQLYYSRTAQTLGTILVHNAERCHTQYCTGYRRLFGLMWAWQRARTEGTGLKEKRTAREPLQAGERSMAEQRHLTP